MSCMMRTPSFFLTVNTARLIKKILYRSFVDTHYQRRYHNLTLFVVQSATMTIQRGLAVLLLTALLQAPDAAAFVPSTRIITTSTTIPRQHHRAAAATQQRRHMSSTDGSATTTTSSSSTQQVPIILNGQNIELTPALVEHINKRIGAQLNKLASNGAVRECDVVLSVNKNPKVRILVLFLVVSCCCCILMYSMSC